MNRLFLFLFLLPSSITAQECACLDNLNWVIETFQDNDAGASYIIGKKGEPAYQKHNEAFRARAKSIQTTTDCTPILYEWLLFFRSGHLGIQPLNQGGGNTSEISKEEIAAQYKNEPTFDISQEDFEARLAQIGRTPTFEGVWQSDSYKIGIVKKGVDYIGFVLEADGVYWHKNQIKVKIKATEKAEVFEADYFMRDHSLRVFTEVKLLGNNYLKTGFVTWKRLQPKYPPDETIKLYFEAINTQVPFVKELSENTMLLRIPYFDGSEKTVIDSVLTAHHEQLIQHENLIIDLRNNGGGSDFSYEKIIPYLYTNPIRIVGMEFLSTPLNNQRMKDLMEDEELPEDWRIWAKESIKKLEPHLGEFVNLDGELVEIDTLETVYESPQNVAILVNENCASTTEQFLLAAKQSTKVKVFGTTTMGALDVSNQHFVPSPCAEFNLIYCLSKSYRIPGMAIDGKGIQPDYYMDNTIEDYEWVKFVRNVLESK